MRKGVHTIAQLKNAALHRLMPHLFVAVAVLIWTAGTVVGQQSEGQAKPEQAADAAPAEAVASEAPPATEEAQWERQIDELTQRRRKLEESADNIEKELQQSEREQEQRRHQLQEQLQDLRSQIRETAAQTVELQRERLKRSYLRELEALEQAYRQQADIGEGTPLPPFGPERIAPLRREQAENIEQIRQELREIHQQREQDGNRWRELREHLKGMTERLDTLSQRAEETQHAITEGRTERQALRKGQAESARQQEKLGTRIDEVAEQQQSLKERAGALAAQFRQDIDRLCTELQRMGQTVGRIEQERLQAEEGLKTQVGQLSDQVRALQTDQANTQNAVNWMLSQSDRSTVGSAGRSWGW